jgi:hypothetical protein
MQTIELEAMYASLLAEIDVFILLERKKEAEGVFAVMTRLICLYGVDGASLHRLFAKLEHIPSAYTYAQNIARLATPEQLILFGSARDSSQMVARMRQGQNFTQPPLLG